MLKEAFKPKPSAHRFLSARPIVGLRDEYPAGFVDPAHRHQRAQLLYACSGVMSVVTEHCIYAVPPQRCLWISAGVSHEVACRSDVSVRTLYIEPQLHPDEIYLAAVDVAVHAGAILEVVDFDIPNRWTL
jgi:mannose-6-phosphate isomerase-like protein (cupin superfamily)